MTDLTTYTGRLVKSAERVRDLGEVFTPTSTVHAMLDLLPVEMWRPHPSATFLEPSCGDGNFIVAVFDRKAKAVVAAWESGELLAGDDKSALLFHLLEALSTIYGIDISQENIDGHLPDHPLGARARTLLHFQRCIKRTLGRKLAETDNAFRSAKWIIWHNIQVGNMLPINADGVYVGTPTLPILEYMWNPTTKRVVVAITNLADVVAAVNDAVGAVPSLFGAPEPVEVWSGAVGSLHQADVPLPDARMATAKKNGTRTRS